jgi:hypothetical protein
VHSLFLDGYLIFENYSFELLANVVYLCYVLKCGMWVYHFTMAYQKGKATDPVKYFADPQNRDLGIIKQKRKPNIKLIVAPFPDLQRRSDQFFFNNSLKAS